MFAANHTVVAVADADSEIARWNAQLVEAYRLVMDGVPIAVLDQIMAARPVQPPPTHAKPMPARCKTAKLPECINPPQHPPTQQNSWLHWVFPVPTRARFW
jgi:hypothetical protein